MPCSVRWKPSVEGVEQAARFLETFAQPQYRVGHDVAFVRIQLGLALPAPHRSGDQILQLVDLVGENLLEEARLRQVSAMNGPVVEPRRRARRLWRSGAAAVERVAAGTHCVQWGHPMPIRLGVG